MKDIKPYTDPPSFVMEIVSVFVSNMSDSSSVIILSSKLSELSQKEQDGFGETELEVMYSQIDQTFENSKMTECKWIWHIDTSLIRKAKNYTWKGIYSPFKISPHYALAQATYKSIRFLQIPFWKCFWGPRYILFSIYMADKSLTLRTKSSIWKTKSYSNFAKANEIKLINQELLKCTKTTLYCRLSVIL